MHIDDIPAGAAFGEAGSRADAYLMHADRSISAAAGNGFALAMDAQAAREAFRGLDLVVSCQPAEIVSTAPATQP